MFQLVESLATEQGELAPCLLLLPLVAVVGCLHFVCAFFQRNTLLTLNAHVLSIAVVFFVLAAIIIWLMCGSGSAVGRGGNFMIHLGRHVIVFVTVSLSVSLIVSLSGNPTLLFFANLRNQNIRRQMRHDDENNDVAL